MAIKSSIDEKQSGATKEYKTKIEVDMDKYWGRNGGGGYWGGEHDDVDMGGWLGRGTPRRRGNGGPGGEGGGGGNKGGSKGSENKEPGGGGGGGGGSKGSENKEPREGGGGGVVPEGPGGKGRGETKGPGGEGGGIENGDHVEHP